MTVCVPTVLFDRCGVIARRRSLAVERRDSMVPESLTQLASLRRGPTRSDSLTRGVAGIKCETSMMPPEVRSTDVDDAQSPAIVEIVGGDSVAESAVDEIDAAVFTPGSSGDRSIGVVDMEVTNSQEGTVDEISTTEGVVSPSTSGVACLPTSGVVCRSDCGSAFGPSTRPSGSTLAWMV